MYWAYITKKVIHIIYLKPAGKLSALDKEILNNANNERDEYADLAEEFGDIEFAED